MYALRDVYAIVDGVRTMVAVKGQPVPEHYAQYVDAEELTAVQKEAMASTLGPADLPGQELATSMSADHVEPIDSEPVANPPTPPAPPMVQPPAPPAPEFYDADTEAEARILGISAGECELDSEGDITEEEVRKAYFEKVTDHDELVAKATQLGVEHAAELADEDLRDGIYNRLSDLDTAAIDQLVGPVDGEVGPLAGEGPKKPYAEMDKAELLAEIERRGLAAPKGRPTNADLVKVLEENTSTVE